MAIDQTYTNSNTRTDTLNQASAHDTGLYDPSLHDNKIVAMYETEERARMARDKLVADGVPSSALHLVDRSQDTYAGGVDYENNTGIWGAIKSLFVPDEDAHGYAEGVNRGHAMLVVDPQGLADRDRVIATLESTDPIDFDSKLEEWRQSGYTYPGEQTGGTVHGADASLATGSSSYGAVPHLSDTAASGHTGAVAATAASVGVAATAMPGAPAPMAPAVPAANTPATARTAGTVATPGRDDETLKVMEERLRVGKREVARGAVRVRSYIVERPVEEQVSLHEERVHLERHPVDRAVDPADMAAFQDRTIEVKAHGEEAVISKEARVIEEIGIRKEASDRVETVRDSVRRTEVEVEDTLDQGRQAGSAAVTGSTGITTPRR